MCAVYRIPHSEFLSWGRNDRDKAIAWHLRQAETHGPCGTRAEEWDEDHGGHRDAYIATPVRCRGCEVRERGEASLPKDAGRGVSIALKPNPKVGRRG